MSARRCLLALRCAADAGALRAVREQVESALCELEVSPKFVSDVVIAVNEACMNVIEHAYGAGARGEIALQIHDNGAALEVELTDFAAPIDVERVRPRALDELRPGGLGTHFMNTIMDDCVYSHLPGGRGNVLRMRKRLAP